MKQKTKMKILCQFVILVGIILASSFVFIQNSDVFSTSSSHESISVKGSSSIMVFDSYSFRTNYTYGLGYSEYDPFHVIRFVAYELDGMVQHNLSLLIDTYEEVTMTEFPPDVQTSILNRTGERLISALFTGNSLSFEIVLAGGENDYPDPFNVSLDPCDLVDYSVDENGWLKFGIIVNASETVENAYLSISMFNSHIEKVLISTELEGTPSYYYDYVRTDFSRVSAGTHRIDFEIKLDRFEGGDFGVSFGSTSDGMTHTPIRCFLDQSEINPEKRTITDYKSQRVDLIKGIVPWVYGYPSSSLYTFNFTSHSDFVLNLEDDSREMIDFLLFSSQVKDFEIEREIFNERSVYKITFRLESSSDVSLGLEIYKKIWFLRPTVMHLSDISQEIVEKYTSPKESSEAKYLDVDNPLVLAWAEEVVGEETNPYMIAYLLFQNLTETLEYDEDWKEIDPPISETLKERRGVCRHFARTYGALCMISELPAKFVRGKAINLGETGEKRFKVNHKWNEVFLPKYGWVTVDVTWKEFAVLPDSHIVHTSWNYKCGSLNYNGTQEDYRIKAHQSTKSSLEPLISLCRQRISRLADSLSLNEQTLSEIATLLTEAEALIYNGYPHEALVKICRLSLLIEDLYSQFEAEREVVLMFFVLFIGLFAVNLFLILKRSVLFKKHLKSIAKRFLKE